MLPKTISSRGTSAALQFNFDCAARGALNFREDRPKEFPMLSVIIGALMVLSIGILIAHAMDAFRS